MILLQDRVMWSTQCLKSSFLLRKISIGDSAIFGSSNTRYKQGISFIPDISLVAIYVYWNFFLPYWRVHILFHNVCLLLESCSSFMFRIVNKFVCITMLCPIWETMLPLKHNVPCILKTEPQLKHSHNIDNQNVLEMFEKQH